jgi:hypothetical protein
MAFGAGGASAQDGGSPLRIFGYFQTLFQHQSAVVDRSALNSFSLQQLNLLFQKELATKWTAFVNVEAVNSFNSKRNFGSIKFEEAWVKYRASAKLSLKVGLQIPTFNNLNEIKNRTPLLPYALRPHVYETSFEEFVSVEEYLPTRGFAQVYGFLPSGKVKLDYAAFLGNSSMVNGDAELGQTGVDTSSSFLSGGRLGLRWKTLKLGVSATHEKGTIKGDILDIHDGPVSDFEDISRVRIGTDVSLDYRDFSLEAELIYLRYGERATDLDIYKAFYYGTLGYYVNSSLFVYASYWYNKEDATVAKSSIKVPTGGLSYHIHDSITFKAQVASGRFKDELKVDLGGISAGVESHRWHFYTAAVSVYF